MIIVDKKFTQEEVDRIMVPIELDMISFFKVLESAVMEKILDDTQSPEQLIQSISTLFGDENTGNVLVRKDDRPINFVNFQGLNIGIENPKGSVRSGVDPDGHKWSVEMKYDYGFIKGKKVIDGDSLDVYLGPNEDSQRVFIIRQQKFNGEFDEYKIMLGFDDRKKAISAYLNQYDSPLFFGGAKEETMEEFKRRMEE